MEKKNTRAVGTKYEDIVSEYLVNKGMVILERNYHNKYAEIDIIAKDKDTFVFCEVKYRGSERFGTGFDAVDIHKQHKISCAALDYCVKKNITDKPCRFDVIAVDRNGMIEHIENAFDYV